MIIAYIPMLPEIVLVAGALVLFIITLGKRRDALAKNATRVILITATVAAVGTLHAHGSFFYSAYRVDLFSQLMKLILLAAAAMVLYQGRSLRGIDEDVRPEWYFFFSVSTLGLLLLVSSVEFITLFVALELASCTMYLMVPLRNEIGDMREHMEAAVKYVMFGIASTGIMLFGVSYLFGLTGTTALYDMLAHLKETGPEPVVIVAVSLVSAGLLFKLAAVPFHFWIADVYQGASNETAAFIAAVPKLGALAVLLRIAAIAVSAGGMMTTIIAVIAALSMFVGNLSALVQKDVKRLIGFSGIAHAGYLLAGVATMGQDGFAFAIYYLAGYTVMTVAVFLVIDKVSQAGENVLIDDLAGLSKRSPLLAALLAAGLFGLAGIPPFVGFMGKFLVLTSAFDKGLIWLVILAVINTALAIYYYLNIIRIAYTQDGEARQQIKTGLISWGLGILLLAVILALGIYPQPFISLAGEAAHLLF
ncbi:MAG: NADH-quinone oxidoreductase subunit N [Spirochaetes bacterium]|nr:NADH-quinone oxidoreductase subunit N [Spirochaetota bacterium]